MTEWGSLTGIGPIGTAGQFEWTIHVRRNSDLARVAQLADYVDCELAPRFNDVGTWTLNLDRRQAAAALLTDPAYGIEVVRDGDPVFSGPVRAMKHVRARSASTLTVAGPDDMVWLARRRAHPQPATAAPPYNTAEFDVRTGACSTVLRQYVDVNAGPGALTQRRVPGMTLSTDPAAGTTVTGRARWEQLLEFLRGLALTGGGLGFRVLQQSGALVFDVYQPADKSATVVFSEELGNLEGYTYERTGPEVNYVYLGGAGEGAARVIRENQISASVVDWGRAEDFVDARSLTNADEMTQASFEALTERGDTTGLSITPVDTAGQAFGTHYALGDRVSAVVDGATVQELIREVKIRLTPDGPATVAPQIGTPGRTSVLALFDGFKRLRRRITNLERR